MPIETHNRYYALRHGISLANEQGIIISHPENGVRGWGLSPQGVAECRRLLVPEVLEPHRFAREETITYTSDFRRAAETARIFCELNDLEAPIAEPRLRERHFGRLENQGYEAYGPIWERDAIDERHNLEGCESTSGLAARLRDLLADLERQWQGKTIVLVSHGDPLQVLQTVLLEMKCNEHRTLPHLGNAELRLLTPGR